MKFLPLTACLVLACLNLAAAPASVASDNQITVKNFMFSPMSLTISPGATVIWKNMDGEPHLVVSIDGMFRSQALDQNDSFAFRFDKPGTYKYICSIHPQMTGTIIVK